MSLAHQILPYEEALSKINELAERNEGIDPEELTVLWAVFIDRKPNQNKKDTDRAFNTIRNSAAHLSKSITNLSSDALHALEIALGNPHDPSSQLSPYAQRLKSGTKITHQLIQTLNRLKESEIQANKKPGSDEGKFWGKVALMYRKRTGTSGYDSTTEDGPLIETMKDIQATLELKESSNSKLIQIAKKYIKDGS